MRNLAATFLVLCINTFTLAEEKVNPFEEDLAWLETADVISDVKNAIATGDLRIKCVMGYALRCPGIKDREGEEYFLIEHTSDVVTSDRHDKLLDLAREYARSYNKYIMEARKIEKAK